MSLSCVCVFIQTITLTFAQNGKWHSLEVRPQVHNNAHTPNVQLQIIAGSHRASSGATSQPEMKEKSQQMFRSRNYLFAQRMSCLRFRCEHRFSPHPAYTHPPRHTHTHTHTICWCISECGSPHRKCVAQ